MSSTAVARLLGAPILLCAAAAVQAQDVAAPASAASVPGQGASPAAAASAPATAPAAAPAATPPPSPPPPSQPAPQPSPADAGQRVEITGGRESDTDQRRQSTAAKIVIGRDQIDKFGDTTLGEVLRRLPGITTPGAPGRGGPPRMRGLGSGYTQLLIDGQRVPRGFSLESLTPEQVERIEILRAPTAETGARAIAGTINIVTREGYKHRVNDLRLGLGFENGEISPGLFWTHNDSSGPLTYNLSGSAFRRTRLSTGSNETTDVDVASGEVVGLQNATSQTLDERRGLNLTARLDWRLGEAGDLVSLTPSVFTSRGNTRRDSTLTQALPPPPELPPYDLAHSDTDGSFTRARLGTMWRQRLTGGGRVELNADAGLWRAQNAAVRQEYRSGDDTPLRRVDDDSDTRETSASLNFKFSRLIGGDGPGAGSEHQFVGGTEFEGLRRNDRRTTLQDGLPLLTEFGDNLQATSLRAAAYAQDEWSFDAHWALHAGLRWEGIHTQGDAGDGTRPSNVSSVWTPLVHLLWKPDPKTRDQLRLSLTRSYRSPSLGQLIARPSLNSRYPPDEPNDPTRPDSAGNPDLQPELASGLDLAFERYLEGGGLLSANLFARRVSDVMRNVVALETVSWSPVPRWVSRPQNVGSATTQGIELEAKYRLDQLFADAPRVELRHNLSVYRSSVDGVPGPDNRLDSQAPATANTGADYRFRGLPLTLGGNVNWVPGYRTQLADDRSATVGSKVVWDGYALWTFSPAVGLRLLGSNLAPRDYASGEQFDDGALRQTSSSLGPSYANWQLRLELKL